MDNLGLERTSKGITTKDSPLENIRNTISSESEKDSNLANNYSFNVESLFSYIEKLYDEDRSIFRETPDGFATSIATYEALSILRILGLDYYLFGEEWQKIDDSIANNLLIDFRDKGDSGGFQLIEEVKSPSLEGTFGVVNSLWLMNELPVPKLKQQAIDLLDFVANFTFNREETEFHEIGQNSSLKSTFQALTILDLVYKVALKSEFADEVITPVVNRTLLEFMTNYSSGIFDFIASFWAENSYFYTQDQYRTPIEDTWYALQSITVLERFGNIIKQNFPNKTIDYEIPVINWLKTTIKTSGVTKGGLGTSDVATVKETGLGYLILNVFNSTNEINHTETLNFINSTQFLERENRTYTASETASFGGFGPNNLTYSDVHKNKLVNIHDTYYAILSLFLSGDIFNSIEFSLETSHYNDYPNINRSNLIIQGEQAEISLFFKVYNYTTHGSLEFETNVDTWNITQSDYSETNKAFTGESRAKYILNLENDSNADFNWTLGNHMISNAVSIRNLPFIRSQIGYFNSSLFVGYVSQVDFNSTEFKPGDNLKTTIFYQNRSVLTYDIQNITIGNISANILSPNGVNETLFEYKPIDITTEALSFVLNISNQALLGTWKLYLSYNQSNFKLTSITPIEVSDTIELYNIFRLPEYYPGEPMNLNISLKYSNNQFTPEANATLIFISNQTQLEVFNISLEYLDGNKYWINNEICPIRFLYGLYNVSVQLTWNRSSGYQTDTVQNKSLEFISIKGNPIMLPINFKTDYRNLSLLKENLLYYGEIFNLSYTVGFESPSKINNITDSKVITQVGLINNTQPDIFIQLFRTFQLNESLFPTERLLSSGLVNPNLPIGTYGTRFKIKSEWNNSFVYLRDSFDTSINASYNITLDGEFTISSVTYANNEVSDDGLYIYALDTSSVISITFRVRNTKLENLIVPNLNAYGILDIKNKEGDLNQSLPNILSAYDENDRAIYQLSIPVAGLKSNEYKISIFTWTAISSHLKIGELTPGFKIVRTLSTTPIIELHEALILIALGIMVVLLYINLKGFR